MPDAKRQVDELRQEMARLDAQLLTALDKRAKAARRLRELRKEHAPQLPVTDQAAIRALVARSSGDMPEESIYRVFREIFGACLALELPIQVAYVGLEGGAAHVAAGDRFGRMSNLVAAETTSAAIEEVSRRRAEFAVVPFESSDEGPMKSTILALVSSDLRITEILNPHVDPHAVNRSGDGERVRYAVIGARPSGRTAEDVTSLVFTVRQDGSLLDVLRVFTERGVNLTNVQSYPARGEAWSHLFYLELPGHFTDRPLVTTFEEIKRLAHSFKVLGSYPKA